MAIELGGGWFLGADQFCYMLGKKLKTPTKKKEMDWQLFFPTLEDALCNFAENMERAEIGCAEGALAREIISAVNRAHEETRAYIGAVAHDFPELPK